MRRSTVAMIHLLIIATISCTASGATSTMKDDMAYLLDEVLEIAAPGVPGPLCVFGPEAFPVVTASAGGRSREPVVAAARMGKGRVVAFGHTGYFFDEALRTADTGRLVENAVRWAAGAGSPKKDLNVGIYKRPELLRYLRQRGFEASEANLAELAVYDVLCFPPVEALTENELNAVSEFVKEGGGLVAAELGWGWAQTHPGKHLVTDCKANRLLAPAGIVWADGYLHRNTDDGYAADGTIPEYAHAARAFEALVANAHGEATLDEAEISQAVAVVSHAARSLPPGDKLLLPKLREIRSRHARAVVPTAEKPVSMENPLERLLLTLQLLDMKDLPSEKVRAHPAASEFPGTVSEDAKRTGGRVMVDTSIPGWHSTGYYAAPGEIIRVVIPKQQVDAGLTLRIGAHEDRLWHLDVWKRCPEITQRLPLSQSNSKASNAFGGLVYIEVPEGCGSVTVPVRFRGVIEAPRYVHGQTTAEEWRRRIRTRPAPWAELETGKVVLTLPSSVVRDLDDPADVMDFWDDVMDCCAELAAISPERERPERYVADVQISAGYMHAGYPIMTHLDIAETMVDKKQMMANGHGGVWGLFHEMGHNHQNPDWTFDGAGEVTVNLFTLYVFDKVCDLRPPNLGRFPPEKRKKMLDDYIATGPDFKEWKRDPFLALLMYVQVQEAFGWDAYKRVFAEYRELQSDQRPKNDDEKRDQWMVRLSQTVGRNLGPFFEAWGVPTTDHARELISDLPTWIAEDFEQ